MNKSEREIELGKSVAESISKRDVRSVPGFDETWVAAEARFLVEKRRYRTVTGVAASLALVAIVLGMLPPDGDQKLPDFELEAGMMNTTLWSAPSDVLMPHYQIDVYQDIPEIPVSTDLNGETLL
jgi:hypothetical protein